MPDIEKKNDYIHLIERINNLMSLIDEKEKKINNLFNYKQKFLD